jgi:LCP family protein required for cell wall assembly
MSDLPSRDDPAGASGPADLATAAQRPRRRRGLRIALISMVSFVVLIGAVAAGGYVYLNHLASSIPRIPVQLTKLTAAQQRHFGGENVLITGNDEPAPGETELSGLIMVLHIDADQRAGGVVSIPPQTVVTVPGYGPTQIWNSLAIGGPSLLVRTVEHLTHVHLDHYARIDFPHVANVVNVIGGVAVILPESTSSFGYHFHAGVNHLYGGAALAYARQPSLTQEGRVLRQQSLIRAVLRKLAVRNLLTNPVTMYRVLHALIGMLTVDSDFTNAELAHLSRELSGLNRRNGTFVTAPVRYRGGNAYLVQRIAQQLWAAIRRDALRAFSLRYPFTVTPVAPR